MMYQIYEDFTVSIDGRNYTVDEYELGDLTRYVFYGHKDEYVEDHKYPLTDEEIRDKMELYLELEEI